MTKLNYCWRIFAAGLCFSIFGIGAIILATVIFPTINFFVYNKIKRNKYIRKSIHLSWKFFVSVMSFTGAISVKVKNIEKLKSVKSCVIVANHPSLIDVVILISLIPQGDCIVKSSLGKNFFMKGVIRAAYILNSTNVDELFLDCKKSLDQGNNLIIFPEGTRTALGEEPRLSRGAAHIAIYSGRNILPIKIECSPRGLLKTQKWYEITKERMKYELEIKEEIKILEYLEREKDQNIAARRVTENIKRSCQ